MEIENVLCLLYTIYEYINIYTDRNTHMLLYRYFCANIFSKDMFSIFLLLLYIIFYYFYYDYLVSFLNWIEMNLSQLFIL